MMSEFTLPAIFDAIAQPNPIYDIADPFAIGDRLYATDRSILVWMDLDRIPEAARKPIWSDPSRKLPDVLSAIVRFGAASDVTLSLVDPSPHKVRCDRCEGGTVDHCQNCDCKLPQGHRVPCWHCDGTGKRYPDGMGVRLGTTILALEYVDLLWRHGIRAISPIEHPTESIAQVVFFEHATECWSGLLSGMMESVAKVVGESTSEPESDNAEAQLFDAAEELLRGLEESA